MRFQRVAAPPLPSKYKVAGEVLLLMSRRARLRLNLMVRMQWYLPALPVSNSFLPGLCLDWPLWVKKSSQGGLSVGSCLQFVSKAVSILAWSPP